MNFLGKRPKQKQQTTFSHITDRMREVGEVGIETEEVRHIVGTEEIFSQYIQVRNQGRAKEKSASEMKKKFLSQSQKGECLSFYFITNAL